MKNRDHQPKNFFEQKSEKKDKNKFKKLNLLAFNSIANNQKSHFLKVPLFKDLGLFQKWNIRKMVFVAMLIAVSVTFTIVGTQIVPIASIPSYKIAFISIPVKISGFIFGPIIGFFVGFMSDLLSLLFVPPAGYHILYTLSAAISGMISGIIGWFFLRFLNYVFSKEFKARSYEYKIWKLGFKLRNALDQKNQNLAVKYSRKIIEIRNKKNFVLEHGNSEKVKNINLFISVILIFIVITIAAQILLNIPKESFSSQNKNILFKNRNIALLIIITGFASMILFVIQARFRLSTSNYLAFAPIIVFSTLLELINIPLLSIADLHSLGSADFLTWISYRIVTSPIKIWFNIFVIYISYQVISRLISKNKNISWI
ncbi:folate family ECF transporter S component [Mycoplasmopsis cricetuli]|uniref:folate family ECF transporter S component n=1 Tax=Mycoplasmopsis cricetuli TaxID=171283 RepID=UPI0004710658|nr:folate family ECF transporter S component [Mycoplasmopsis cricetuli]